MGRVKTRQIKRITLELFKRYGTTMPSTFEENKAFTNLKVDVHCKKLRNVIAGYSTRLKQIKQ